MKPRKTQSEKCSNNILFDTIFDKVVEGLKYKVPIYKMLSRYKYERATFYQQLNKDQRRYLNELKALNTPCMTNIKYGYKNTSSSPVDLDTADYSIC